MKKPENHSQSDIYIFKLNIINRIFARHIYSCSFVFVCLLLLWETIFGLPAQISEYGLRVPIATITIYIPLFLIILLVIYLITYRLACCIKFDFSKDIIEITLCRKKSRTIFRLKDLEAVETIWHTHLVFKDGRKVRFMPDRLFWKFLKEIEIPLKWSKFARLLNKRDLWANN